VYGRVEEGGAGGGGGGGGGGGRRSKIKIIITWGVHDWLIVFLFFVFSFGLG